MDVSDAFLMLVEKQLGLIMTAALAIPLADDLPMHNARKTCALAIWLIQVQRLPAEVLQPTASRIAYALRRGIDGELGKEGKKGSANDGMKVHTFTLFLYHGLDLFFFQAIHDLCVYLPAVFIPAFVDLLPSLLTNLLASTLALRTQACHALGGFVLGSTSIPLSTVHTRISNIIATYLTTIVPSPNAKSPSKATDATIVRTLRTTIGNAEPLHVAQGPVWAISVLASMVVLLGSKLCADQKVNRIVSSLLSLGMRHPKSSVRALCCIAWRSITWVYFQPLLPVESDAESEVDDEVREKRRYARQAHLKVMSSVVDCQAGVATIAALLGESEEDDDDALKHSIKILQSMAAKSGNTCIDSLETIRHMVSSADAAQSDSGSVFNLGMLLPKGLFAANPGLLTTDFKSLSTAVRPIFDEMSVMEDVRCLTREEISKEWVFKGLMEAWKTGLGYLELCDDAEVPVSFLLKKNGLNSELISGVYRKTSWSLGRICCRRMLVLIRVCFCSTRGFGERLNNGILQRMETTRPLSNSPFLPSTISSTSSTIPSSISLPRKPKNSKPLHHPPRTSYPTLMRPFQISQAAYHVRTANFVSRSSSGSGRP